MHALRRKEKEITDRAGLHAVLKQTRYITIAMCAGSEPYLVTLSHGYDEPQNVLYFHCAREGKKITILEQNPTIWGQAMRDDGYGTGRCDHYFASVHFRGHVSFVDDPEEKKHALAIMIRQLEPDPETVMQEQMTDSALAKVKIGRIAIDYLSGKQSPAPVAPPHQIAGSGESDQAL